MKHVFLPIFFILFLFLSGCAYQTQKILEADFVSMTESKPPSTPLKKGQKLKAKWCLDQKPVLPQGDEIGMIDQVVMKAQKKYKIKYIVDPKFTWVPGSLFTSPCLVVVGFVGGKK